MGSEQDLVGRIREAEFCWGVASEQKPQVGRPGLEPGTYGLKVRYSAIELTPRRPPPGGGPRHEAYRVRRLARSRRSRSRQVASAPWKAPSMSLPGRVGTSQRPRP